MSFTPKGLLSAIVAAADEETKRQKQKKTYRYFARYVGPEPRQEFTRAEVKDRLEGWMEDVESAISLLEDSPGDEHRLTAFAFYWAEEVTS